MATISSSSAAGITLASSPWLPLRQSETRTNSTRPSRRSCITLALSGRLSSLLCPSRSLGMPPTSPSPFSDANSLHHSISSSAFSIHQLDRRALSKRVVSMKVGSGSVPGGESEEVFFDGGVHYGDLVTNLIFGLTLVWLPLTMAAVFRNLFLRYRFTDSRVTIMSGLLGGDRKDFAYESVKGVKVVPRFIGEWGDMAIELKDGTKVDIRSIPKFREIAKYVEERAAAASSKKKGRLDPSVVSSTSTSKKGFL